MLAEELGGQAEPVHGPARPGEVRDSLADISAARNRRNNARLAGVTGIRNEGAGATYTRELRGAIARELSLPVFIMSFLSISG